MKYLKSQKNVIQLNQNSKPGKIKLTFIITHTHSLPVTYTANLNTHTEKWHSYKYWSWDFKGQYNRIHVMTVFNG